MSITQNNKQEIIDEYLRRVLDINQHINLTNINTFEEASLLHIEDSLSIMEEVNTSIEGELIDLGSGGGFPGVPIAIQSERNTVLIDSVKKKMEAVDNILSSMNLNNISVSCLRIEEYTTSNIKRFSVAVSRAMTSIPSLLELASPLLKKNGSLIIMKANKQDYDKYDEDIALEKLGMKQTSYREYSLRNESTGKEINRSVYVFDKVRPATVDLPRRNGVAQKRPISGL